MPVSEIPAIQSFIDYIRFEKRYSPHTVKSYSDDLEDFFAFLAGRCGITMAKEVTPLFIRSWLADMADRKMNPRSINRKLSCLKSFFKFCRKTGLLADNPASVVPLMKTRKRLPSYVEEKQMAVLSDTVEFPADFTGQTEKMIVGLLYQTGIRVSELVNMKNNHIDIPQQQLKVLGKGNKERLIPLNRELLSQLHAYGALRKKNEVKGEYLFANSEGKPLNPRKVYTIVKKWLSVVTTAEKKSPHILRHSFATHLTNNGADLNAVKELLGHTSLAATQVYTHNSIEKLRDIHKKAHPKG
jgi:integrase/recombinase XerC